MENDNLHGHCVECNKVLLSDNDKKRCPTCWASFYPSTKTSKLELRTRTLSILHYLIKLVENDRL